MILESITYWLVFYVGMAVMHELGHVLVLVLFRVPFRLGFFSVSYDPRLLTPREEGGVIMAGIMAGIALWSWGMGIIYDEGFFMNFFAIITLAWYLHGCGSDWVVLRRQP